MGADREETGPIPIEIVNLGSRFVNAYNATITNILNPKSKYAYSNSIHQFCIHLASVYSVTDEITYSMIVEYISFRMSPRSSRPLTMNSAAGNLSAIKKFLIQCHRHGIFVDPEVYHYSLGIDAKQSRRESVVPQEAIHLILD